MKEFPTNLENQQSVSQPKPQLPPIASQKRTATRAKIIQFPLNRRLTAVPIRQHLATQLQKSERLAAELEAANRELRAIALAVPRHRRIVRATKQLEQSIELYLAAIASPVKQKPARTATPKPNGFRAKMLTITKLVKYFKRAVLRSLGVQKA
jgi:hypothetical protein